VARMLQSVAGRRCPVAVSYQKILVPIDGTSLAERVLEVAFIHAARFGGDVYVLQIREQPQIDSFHVEPTLGAIEVDSDHLLAGVRSRAEAYGIPPARVHAHLRSGPLADTIVTAVDELGADLVVMGTHGRHGVLDLFAGSTTERVVRRTAAPVLVVKPVGFPDQVED
jgi:nucleotide-binding universal stress UspA family protein